MGFALEVLMIRSLLSRSLSLVVLWPLVATGCAEVDLSSGEVGGRQVDGVWVFVFEEEPTLIMQALTGGSASVVDGCLFVDDQVVVWYDHHVAKVEELVASLNDGQEISIEGLGGGGISLDEGSTTDEFPPEVLEHCSPTAVWFSGPDDFTVTEE